MRSEIVFATAWHRMAYVLITTPIALLLGIFMGKALLPWIQAAFIFPLYYHTLSRRQWEHTFALMAAWALILALVAGLLSYGYPERLEQGILNAAPYKQEMFHWIETGVGPEGDINQFLPQHAIHFLVFAVLTLISGGFLGLVMGAALVNYMSFYVGSLLIQANSLGSVILLAWPPWAIARVGGFILLAMVLSVLVYDGLKVNPANQRKVKIYTILGLFLLALDVALKWRFAAFWQALLNELTSL